MEETEEPKPKVEEEEDEDEIVESDVDLEGDTVEPDNDSPQKCLKAFAKQSIHTERIEMADGISRSCQCTATSSGFERMLARWCKHCFCSFACHYCYRCFAMHIIHRNSSRSLPEVVV